MSEYYEYNFDVMVRIRASEPLTDKEVRELEKNVLQGVINQGEVKEDGTENLAPPTSEGQSTNVGTKHFYHEFL